MTESKRVWVYMYLMYTKETPKCLHKLVTRCQAPGSLQVSCERRTFGSWGWGGKSVGEG